MTTVPKPDDPTQSFTATYDAWNRLTKLEDNSAVVAEYEYGGAKRRTIKKTYASGVLDETRHLYYTEPTKWQVIEERVDSSTDAERQFVWGQRYVDEIILRDRDTTGDATLNERLYGLQDANWNVTALIDAIASVQERCAYQAYGNTEILTPTFADQATSSFDWETTYAGYRLDEESSLFCVRNRFLHHKVAWLSRDPLAAIIELSSHSIGVNLYEYASSNPINASDPSGEMAAAAPAIVVGAAGLIFAQFSLLVLIYVGVLANVLLAERALRCGLQHLACLWHAYRRAYHCTRVVQNGGVICFLYNWNVASQYCAGNLRRCFFSWEPIAIYPVYRVYLDQSPCYFCPKCQWRSPKRKDPPFDPTDTPWDMNAFILREAFPSSVV